MDREIEVQNLINPDEAEQEHQYGFTDGFLQSIIGSLLVDSHFLLQCINLVKPVYFRHEAHKMICKVIFEYHEKYNDRPSVTVIEEELTERIKEPGTLALYLSELDACCESFEPGVEKQEYFLDKITEFAKTQALRVAYTATVEIFESKRKDKDKWSKIREILQEALLVDRNVDLGLPYLDTVEERYKRMMEKKGRQDFFPTDIPSIDAALEGGLTRGEIGAFAGMSNSGKSLALVKVAKANLQRGRNVLYISLEMDEDKIAERFDSMLTTVPIRSLYFGEGPKFVKGALEEGAKGWGKIVIKQFPAGAADVTTCRAFINQLSLHGFKPDLVVVDYVGEMRDTPGIKTYESRQRLIRDLRGMAVELQVCVWTAMQINRGGRDALKEQEYIDDDLLADSAGQNRPLDLLITVSQTEVESKAGVGTFFLSKNRSGKSRFMVKFSRDPDTLEMNEISNERWKVECSKVKDKVVEDVVLEDYAKDTEKYFTRNRA
jgi:replicative DNA helicase